MEVFFDMPKEFQVGTTVALSFFMKKDSDEAGVKAFLSEYAKQARKIARKQRKKQENETQEDNMF